MVITRLTRNQLTGQTVRGFESLHLRHSPPENIVFSGGYSVVVPVSFTAGAGFSAAAVSFSGCSAISQNHRLKFRTQGYRQARVYVCAANSQQSHDLCFLLLKNEPTTAFYICVLSALHLCVWLSDN